MGEAFLEDPSICGVSLLVALELAFWPRLTGVERVGGEFDLRPKGGIDVCPIFETLGDVPSELFE